MHMLFPNQTTVAKNLHDAHVRFLQQLIDFVTVCLKLEKLCFLKLNI